MEVAGFFQSGTRINYAPAPGLTPFLGDTTDAFVRVTFRPTTAVRFEQSYIFTHLEAPTFSAGVPRSGRIFVNHLARSKLSLQLTRELSVRAIVDYGRILSDPTLTVVEPGRRVGGDLLGTYQLNPWTALYVGYADTSEDVAIQGADSAALRRTPGLHRTSRQMFAKASYVVRF